MLIKVALSYYMEGEHRQGASQPRVSAWGLQLEGGCEVTERVRRLRRCVGLRLCGSMRQPDAKFPAGLPVVPCPKGLWP